LCIVAELMQCPAGAARRGFAPSDLSVLIRIRFLPPQYREFPSSLTPWISSLWIQAWKLGKRTPFLAATGH